jgi:hypothetical protein
MPLPSVGIARRSTFWYLLLSTAALQGVTVEAANSYTSYKEMWQQSLKLSEVRSRDDIGIKYCVASWVTTCFSCVVLASALAIMANSLPVISQPALPCTVQPPVQALPSTPLFSQSLIPHCQGYLNQPHCLQEDMLGAMIVMEATMVRLPFAAAAGSGSILSTLVDSKVPVSGWPS